MAERIAKIIGAGVVGGQDGGVGEPGRGGAHRAALGGVAAVAAAAADDHVQPALGDLAQGAQDRFDGVRLFVGVVDDREVRLAGVDPLQAAGDAGDGGDALAALFGSMPAVARVAIAARVLATLNGPGSGAVAAIRSPRGRRR
ncbi:hypothetical protein SNARM312S_08236 [Streptomyces narbonensis]